jgi:hypothetical protein
MDFESLLYLILTEGNNSSIYHIYYLDNDYFIVPEVIHSIPLSVHSHDYTLFILFNFPDVDPVRYS